MKLGILCGGGPAPGMNSVISAATIEARNSGWDVLGIMDGFEHLIEGRIEEARPLSITDVSRIHVLGGSILRTSRANPTVRDEDAADPDWRLHACLESLRKLGIDALVTIGGDDTAFSASRLAEAAGGDLRVAHVPKTIDNDLPLPGGIPTFGFETARSVGVQLVNNLMTDAITTQRWYLVVAMGRSAGHLALGIAKSAGATLAVIGEEFPGDEPIPLSRLVDVLETSMLKRIAHGRPFGVAVLAEGIGLRLPRDELLKAMPEVELDEHGHVRLAELELDRLLAKQVKDRFKERGQKITVEGKNIGYELRCAPPIPFDIEYTRDLGYSAVDYLKGVLRGRRTWWHDHDPGGAHGGAALRVVQRPRDGAGADPAGERRVELVPGGPRVHDPAGPRGPRGSGEAPPDRSGLRAHARGLPRPVRLSSSRAEPRPPSGCGVDQLEVAPALPRQVLCQSGVVAGFGLVAAVSWASRAAGSSDHQPARRRDGDDRLDPARAADHGQRRRGRIAAVRAGDPAAGRAAGGRGRGPVPAGPPARRWLAGPAVLAGFLPLLCRSRWSASRLVDTPCPRRSPVSGGVGRSVPDPRRPAPC